MATWSSRLRSEVLRTNDVECRQRLSQLQLEVYADIRAYHSRLMSTLDDTISFAETAVSEWRSGGLGEGKPTIHLPMIESAARDAAASTELQKADIVAKLNQTGLNVDELVHASVTEVDELAARAVKAFDRHVQVLGIDLVRSLSLQASQVYRSPAQVSYS